MLLHRLHLLKNDGVIATILPQGVLFRGEASQLNRTVLFWEGEDLSKLD